jgi:hypothetical protein
MKRIAFVIVMVVMLALPSSAQEADLSAVKSYLTENVASLDASGQALLASAQAYHALAEAQGFDYAALWASDRVAVIASLSEAKHAWLVASPLYEQVEGIVAGVPSLNEYDVILDAGGAGDVPFDITTADGRTFASPGNLFGFIESTLWGTVESYSSGVFADLNLNSEADFGEALPDAIVLLAAAEQFAGYTTELVGSAGAWEPTPQDAFTALVVMVPTMSEYFASWRDSRFVLGDASTQADFGVISRLSDIKDILGGLLVVYDNVQPLIESVDSAQAAQIRQDLLNLQTYVADLLAEEQAGRQFTPEEADLFGSEAQGRAQAITGQIAQVAALVGVELSE